MTEKMHKVVPDTFPTFDENKKTRVYPTFSLDDEDLPEIKDWKVGKKYKIVMEIEEISMRQGSEWQGADSKDKKMHATFKILKVGVEEPMSYGEEYADKLG